MSGRPSPGQRRVVSAVALVLAIVALKLLSIGFFSERGARAYDGQRFSSAESSYRVVNVLNVVERWKAPFNRGVARYGQADYPGAIEDFRRALDLAPERCDVRLNLVLAIEADVDAQADRAGEATTRGRYLEALDIARRGDCGIDDPTAPTTTTAPSDTTEPSSATTGPSPATTVAEGATTAPATTTGEDGSTPGSSAPDTTTGKDGSTPGSSAPDTTASDGEHGGEPDRDATETTQSDAGDQRGDDEQDQPSPSERLEQAQQRLEDKLGATPRDPASGEPTPSTDPSSPPSTSPDSPTEDQQQQLEERIRQAGEARRQSADREAGIDSSRDYDEPRW